ncbi:MAG TPA: SpoIIE family protein phosphatase [Acidisarcina sp.]
MRKALLRLLFVALASLAALETAAAASPSPDDAPNLIVSRIQLGESFTPLAGPWKFAPADSPRQNGTLLWASPAFDDSAWANMDLHGDRNASDAAYGNPGYVTGWVARGYPSLSGFAWYRLRLHVVNTPAPLWIKMPDHVDDAYQVYANGKYLGEFGDFAVNPVQCYRSRPVNFELPAPDEHGDILLAIRFYMEPVVFVRGTTSDSGGMHQTPLLGLHSELESIRSQEVTGRILSIIVPVFVSLLMIIAAAGAFWIWLLDRPSATYLWLTLGLLLLAAPTLVLCLAFFTTAITQGQNSLIAETLAAIGLVCWLLFWRQWFHLARNRLVELLIVTLAGIDISLEFLLRFAVQMQAHTVRLILEAQVACNFTLALLLFAALLQGARKDRVAKLLALPPILLLTISLLSAELIAQFNIRTSVFPFGIQISVQDVAYVLLVLVVSALVFRRFTSTQVAQRLQRQAVEQELEQARELQQHVLIPEPVTSALFAVETAYYPARQVGGDFFQVIPHRDGSLLIVVGDVSGKGMAAAMLVAVLVGSIRTRADETGDPAAILHTLNDRLLGRAGDHFATCIAAHLRPGGTMLIANAGHLPPYRNGLPLDLPGSLPLGIDQDAEYGVHALQLDPADHITFLTDGVLEARDATGQLLGFDQMAKLSSLPPEAIAQAAINHGQDDDITIVSVHLRAAAIAIESPSVYETSPR